MDHWITDFLNRTGYVGVTLLMIAENVFPPIPSELIMPLAGYTAARGDLRLSGVLLAGTLGSVLGSLPWYVAGRWLGGPRLRQWVARHGRWLTLSPADVDHALAAFNRHCGKAVLFGRMVPAVRTLISAPAGVTRMPLWRFLGYSAVGSAIWTGALATAGYALGARYANVSMYIGPVSNGVLAVVALVYIWRLVRWAPDHSA
jgi:membrane protein DedA with SNARE-associated domain